MKIKISFKYVISFLLLLIVMLELHEIVHIVTGRLICGCWGVRDFNSWNLCADCSEHHPLSWISTLSGPVFTFALMWVGMFLLNSKQEKMRFFGFALIFANIPFGRISQVMMGSGDEMMVMRNLFKADLTSTQQIWICTLIVLAAGLPPIIMAWRKLENKYAWLYIICFLTLPLVFLLTYILTLLNGFLNSGFLATPWIMGTPLLITLHTVIALVLLLLLRKELYTADQKS